MYRYSAERVVWSLDDDDSFWQPVFVEAVPIRDILVYNTIRTHRHVLAKIRSDSDALVHYHALKFVASSSIVLSNAMVYNEDENV